MISFSLIFSIRVKNNDYNEIDKNKEANPTQEISNMLKNILNLEEYIIHN